MLAISGLADYVFPTIHFCYNLFTLQLMGVTTVSEIETPVILHRLIGVSWCLQLPSTRPFIEQLVRAKNERVSNVGNVSLSGRHNNIFLDFVTLIDFNRVVLQNVNN